MNRIPDYKTSERDQAHLWLRTLPEFTLPSVEICERALSTCARFNFREEIDFACRLYRAYLNEGEIQKANALKQQYPAVQKRFTRAESTN